MATTDEKSSVPPQETSVSANAADANEAQTAAIPNTWMYKRPSLGPLKLPYYASPMSQVLIVSFVCFLCPGMFNAVNGIGAGGQVDAHTSEDANIALYAFFSVVGFFAGSIINIFGVKWTLGFGGIGYVVYIASFLSFNHDGNVGFVIFAGCLLGVCAGLLWAAQGTIILSYPPEDRKGRYFATFWVIFNLGGVLGSLIPLGQNLNNTGGTVNDGTYIGFIVLMAAGALLAFTLADPSNVIRDDGSRVILMKHPTWQTEILALFETLKTDSYIIALFPMFFASNFFYTYQFNGVNLAHFTLRTRSLNGLLYWLSQMIAAGIWGYFLDLKFLSRSMRAKMGITFLGVLTLVIWGGGYAFQRTIPSDYSGATKIAESSKMDWTTPGYIGPMALYMFYGGFDAVWQTTAYWTMGALTNNSRRLAIFVGFYKGIQSAGNVIAFGIDFGDAPYYNQFFGDWALLIVSVLIAAPISFFKVQNHSDLIEDLKFSDETVADVLPQKEGHAMETIQ